MSSEPRREGAHYPNLHLGKLFLWQWEEVHWLCFSFKPRELMLQLPSANNRICCDINTHLFSLKVKTYEVIFCKCHCHVQLQLNSFKQSLIFLAQCDICISTHKKNGEPDRGLICSVTSPRRHIEQKNV